MQTAAMQEVIWEREKEGRIGREKETGRIMCGRDMRLHELS